MPERSAGERLDGNAGGGEGPGFAETVDDRTRVEAPSGRVEVARRVLQDIVSGGPADGSELGSDSSVLSCMPGLEGLGHRPEIVTQASGLRCGDPEGIRGFKRLQSV